MGFRLRAPWRSADSVRRPRPIQAADPAKCGIRADRTRDRDVWPEKWPKLTLRVVMNSCNFPVSIRSGGQMRNFKMKISPVRRPPDGPRAYVNAHSGHQTFVLNTIWPMAFSILKGQLVR